MKNNLQNATVLITGGAGFVGSHLVDSLVTFGAREIRVLDDLSRGRLENLTHALSSGRVRFYHDDIRNAALVHHLADGCDVIFHLAAWRIHRCETDPKQALDVMVAGTHTVLEAAACAGVKQFIYASSASVYGQATAIPTPETHPPYANDTIYGWAKLLGEGLVKRYVMRRSFRGICLRFFNVYGPRMDLEGKYTEVMIRWIDAVLRNEPPVIHGDGSASYDFVHVRDVVGACLLAADADCSWGVYNVGTGRETSLLELARILVSLLGKPDIKPHFLCERAPNVFRRCADLNNITRDLGYRPTISLREGLSDLIRWYISRKSYKCTQEHMENATRIGEKP